jgi:hypothetical protein
MVAENGRRLLADLRHLMDPQAPIVVATVYDPSDGSGMLAGLVFRPGRRHWSCWPSSTESCGRWPQSTRPVIRTDVLRSGRTALLILIFSPT